MRWIKSKNKGGYGNVKKTTVKYKGESITLDSKFEAQRVALLIQKEKNGEITNLTLQPRFILIDGFMIFSTKVKNGKSKQSTVSYTSDVKYVDNFGRTIVEEIKGFETDIYKLRRRIFLKQLSNFKIDIFREIFDKKIVEYKPFKV